MKFYAQRRRIPERSFTTMFGHEDQLGHRSALVELSKLSLQIDFVKSPVPLNQEILCENQNLWLLRKF